MVVELTMKFSVFCYTIGYLINSCIQWFTLMTTFKSWNNIRRFGYMCILSKPILKLQCLQIHAISVGLVIKTQQLLTIGMLKYSAHHASVKLPSYIF